MNQIPEWWLIVTGLACLLFVVLMGALVFLLVTLIKVVKELQKPVASLIVQVNELVPSVKSLIVKVEELTVKVDGIADSTRGTVDIVGAKAQGIATTVDRVTTIVSQRLQQYAPVIGTVLTGIRLFNAFREYRTHARPKVRVKGSEHGTISLEVDSANGEERPKKGKVNEHRGVEQSGSSSGS